ncbi:type 2 DNA topoisomerase 6 subunit B-like isoform X2 [Arachis duranensis]|uniref:Type 2 DNA topoisomerase 6 subunit B-like isoform X2 n=1 Tax=Arachis duranensis TaxID=130453 RepID=A0A9C6TPW9_ARADU|nr:type 2 DNA topoisomerase 6 subunit B-like isoform X2 [Arachis hypogaea]XP_052118015.1 type 2 DNA topoisomerase 6 subunit B-like isoform X2 [Arachis duranensis]XP_057761332.1 type 2 DNA topoisomerase 6 subunit B-like isoform X2 [Arachis stenosperma]
MRFQLISSAFQRCRLSEQICRLSVILARSSSSSLRVSISDTGNGSCLEEFQGLRFSSNDDADNWDGMLSIKTTSISDTEIHNYTINLKASDSSKITRLTSNTKNGARFSGSEVCLSSFVSIDLLVAEIHQFLEKMMILSIPNVATHLVAEDCDVPGSRYEKVFLANGDKELPIPASNLDLLKSGLEDYVLRHGNTLSNKCHYCFPNWEQLKVGSGVACSIENHQHNELVMEAVIIISNMPVDNTECFRKYGDKTEVFYFKDFSPGTVSKSLMKALKGIDWKSYGLKLGGIVQQDRLALLEWENLTRDTHVDIVLHSYNKQTVIPGPRKITQTERNLVKRAVKLSLDDLKEKHAGVLLSSHAVQVRSYAPDLAKTIAGLILSSSDLNFQEECFSLLGLQSQVVGTENMENCIRERIVSVIEMNDKKPHKNKVAPSLFVDDRAQELEFEENDMEEGEDDLDLQLF